MGCAKSIREVGAVVGATAAKKYYLDHVHICQPLDVRYRDETCDQYMSTNPGKAVNIYQVPQLLSVAWSKVMTPCNITSGFRATGVFPVNKYTISQPGEKPRLPYFFK